jgi:hypothetical protein
VEAAGIEPRVRSLALAARLGVEIDLIYDECLCGFKAISRPDDRGGIRLVSRGFSRRQAPYPGGGGCLEGKTVLTPPPHRGFPPPIGHRVAVKASEDPQDLTEGFGWTRAIPESLGGF